MNEFFVDIRKRLDILYFFMTVGWEHTESSHYFIVSPRSMRVTVPISSLYDIFNASNRIVPHKLKLINN